MEPMQQPYKLESYRRRLDLETTLHNVHNKIWAFVDQEWEVTVLMDREQHLTLRLINWDVDMTMIVTLVYAKCDSTDMIELWDDVYYLARDMTDPWLVAGDFHVITDESEKYGGLPVSLNEVEDFRHCISTCNLTDLGYKGSVFTWWNGRDADDCIFKRLDRCLSNFEFQQLFPSLQITHLIKNGSDHSPLLIELELQANWCIEVEANSFYAFNSKLKNLKKALTAWSRATYGDIFQQITNMEEVVKTNEAIFEAYPSYANREQLNRINAEMTRLLSIEEEFWKQKAGMAWFQDGDKNSKFFHAHVDSKSKRLQLRRIQYANGQWLEIDAEIAEEAIRFYQAQFHETTPPTQFDILEHIPRLVSQEQNAALVDGTTKKEVKCAVFGLNSTCTAGLRTSQVYHPYKPYTVVNKVFSRVVHERLALLIPELISQNLAGFVRGRSIVENILLTKEIIIEIRLRINKGKKSGNQIVPNVVMKLDMTKAYDRLSWIFLTKVEEVTGIKRKNFPLMYLGCPIYYARACMAFYSELITKFFWSNKIGEWQRHWAGWDIVCLPLDEGGLGFSCLRDISLTLFTKLWWNFRTKPTLWSAFMSNKYLNNNNPILVPWKKGSHIWRKMLQAKDFIDHEIWWQLKMGSSLLWLDNWTGLGPLYFLIEPDFYCDEGINNVADVVTDGMWNEALIRNILPEDLAEYILSDIEPPIGGNDLDILEVVNRWTIQC
ncbi:uncharacterized protein LOC132639425 [Lycium barbarum]|uniref:uncharacterized protein LOC132639425 n=1 Tax=Lycium barbarum TaxID=112863 RepID=UPI00293E7F32|nr:uncharacterized protein LOC132639425 [Lycium barbarum]